MDTQIPNYFALPLHKSTKNEFLRAEDITQVIPKVPTIQLSYHPSHFMCDDDLGSENMTYYLRANHHGIPDCTEIASVYHGIPRGRFAIKFFKSDEELKECKKEDMVVGYIPETQRHLARFGVELPQIDYPDELKDYLGRRIWKSVIYKVLADDTNYPIFVKPIRKVGFHSFNGTVVYDLRDNVVRRLRRYRGFDEVYCSEVIDILAEWRVFVRYNEILDVRPYKKNWKVFYDLNVIESAIKDYSGSAPAAYGIDFGVTSEGKTVLIEVNDAYSIGSYGLDDFTYVKFLTTRWCELMGIEDPFQK